MPPLKHIVKKGGVAGTLYIFFWLPSIVFTCLYVYTLCMICKGLVKDTLKYGIGGYRLKVALKIHVAIFEWLEEEGLMRGIRYDKAHDYVCKCDKGLPKEEQAVFEVRFLTAPEQAVSRDDLYAVSGFGETRTERLRTGTTSLEALKKGLKGWRNFKYDDTGEDIPFNEDNFSCIPPEQRDEIADYIRGVRSSET